MRREDNQRREEKRTEAKRSDPKRKEERREKRIASRLPCPILPTCGLMPSASEGHRRVLFAKLLACAVHSLTRPRIISNIIMYWILLTPGRHSLWCPDGIWQENWNRDPSPFVTGCLPSWCAPHRWYIGVAPPTVIVVVAITRIIV